MPTPVAVPVPTESRVAGLYPRSHLADAFAIELPSGTVGDAEALARFVFLHQPRWVRGLMALRDALVAGLGLKTARQLRAGGDASQRERVGIFRIYERRPNEVVLGEDDRHLDFRVSALHRPALGTAPAQLVLSTVVHCHNRLGRTYLALIAPFHRQVVQAGLRSAARRGWPRQPAA